MTEALRIRHRINAITRDHMDSLGFLEVETPLLTRSTPEGARDFLVPSRLWPGTFYALPQSPQQLKQLLMVAGQDRYYQIVRCLRDEAPRADRSFEFTQLDVEMSFVDQEDVFAVIEPLYARFVREIHGVEVPTPFPRMTYDEMLRRFGSDKPDLRYGLELADLGSVFAGTGFNAFASVLATEDGAIRDSRRGAGSSRKELDQLVQDAKGRGAAGLVWIVVEGDGVRSPVEKHLSKDEVDGVLTMTGASEGTWSASWPTMSIGCTWPSTARDGTWPIDSTWFPRESGATWYTDPPCSTGARRRKWVSNHHPFTSPASDDLDPKTATSRDTTSS